MIKKIEFSLIIFLTILVGCAPHPKAKAPYTPSDAEKKLVELARSDYHYLLITKRVANTQYIYVPLRKEIVGVKASHGQSMPWDKRAGEKLDIRFLDSQFVGKEFHIDYDISKAKMYMPQDKGYGSSYTEAYSKAQNDVLSLIQRTLFDLPDQNTKENTAPEFVVILVADIINGVEIEAIFHLFDLKRAMSIVGDINQEEYAKRIVADLRGSESIIEDTTGEHIGYKPITLENFLARQIHNRINVKYTQSSFPPSEDTRKEILSIVADTVRAYDFKDFAGVTLTNVDTSWKETISQENLLKEFDAKKSSEGRYHVINFMPDK